MPCSPEYASEFAYRPCLLTPNHLVIAVSQSGETADTREALKTAIQTGAKTAGIVNVVGSQIARLAQQGMYLHAGPEIGVASTKAFTCQVTAMVLLAGYFSKDPLFRAEVQVWSCVEAVCESHIFFLFSHLRHHCFSILITPILSMPCLWYLMQLTNSCTTARCTQP